jgi:hypothetical protein
MRKPGRGALYSRSLEQGRPRGVERTTWLAENEAGHKHTRTHREAAYPPAPAHAEKEKCARRARGGAPIPHRPSGLEPAYAARWLGGSAGAQSYGKLYV